MLRSEDLINLIKEYRWPMKGDRLLRDSEDRNRSVDFCQDKGTRHVAIWTGYMNAGAALIKVCHDKPNERYYLVYPILFNYRHAIELAMKYVIAAYVRYSSAEMPKMRTHNLWQLWKVCKQIIVECGSSDDAIYVVEQVIKDFHDLDKSALAFRYSRDQNGAAIALPDGLIDLNNILYVMEALNNFFEGVDGQLDANVSAMEW